MSGKTRVLIQLDKGGPAMLHKRVTVLLTACTSVTSKASLLNAFECALFVAKAQHWRDVFDKHMRGDENTPGKLPLRKASDDYDDDASSDDDSPGSAPVEGDALTLSVAFLNDKPAFTVYDRDSDSYPPGTTIKAGDNIIANGVLSIFCPLNATAREQFPVPCMLTKATIESGDSTGFNSGGESV